MTFEEQKVICRAERLIDISSAPLSSEQRPIELNYDSLGIGYHYVGPHTYQRVNGVGGRKAESDSRKRRLLEASAALNAKHIKIGDFYNCLCPIYRITDAFALLCAEATEFGATIGFELMGCAMINTIKDALYMVETAGASNGGIILDIVQIANLGISFDEIRRIPLSHLVNIELNDGTLPGSPNYDPSRTRRFCGEGEFDIRGLIRCAQGMGYAGPWAVEVMSEELTRLPLDELNRMAFQTTMAEFNREN